MSVYKANPRRDYWRGRPGFGKYMAEKRVDAIMTAFSLPRYQKNHDGWGARKRTGSDLARTRTRPTEIGLLLGLGLWG